MKILVAEDDISQLQRIELYLKKWNYEFVSCRNGDKVWEIIESGELPNFLLLDWLMPGKSGVEICRKVRRLEREDYTYILMLTAKSSKKDISLAMEAGADDYMAKPFYPLDLEVRINLGKRILKLEKELKAAKKMSAGDSS